MEIFSLFEAFRAAQEIEESSAFPKPKVRDRVDNVIFVNFKR